MAQTSWYVTPRDDELLIELTRDKELTLIISVGPDGIGYGYKDGSRFKPGNTDAAADFAGAMRELTDLIAAAST